VDPTVTSVPADLFMLMIFEVDIPFAQPA